MPTQSRAAKSPFAAPISPTFAQLLYIALVRYTAFLYPLLQEVSVQSGEEPICSDVAILSAAASQMFECTRDMSREAVVSLLSGLRDVSVKHIPHAVQVQQPK